MQVRAFYCVQAARKKHGTLNWVSRHWLCAPVPSSWNGFHMEGLETFPVGRTASGSFCKGWAATSGAHPCSRSLAKYPGLSARAPVITLVAFISAKCWDGGMAKDATPASSWSIFLFNLNSKPQNSKANMRKHCNFVTSHAISVTVLPPPPPPPLSLSRARHLSACVYLLWWH